MATVTISIPTALKAKLRRGAIRKGISPDEYIVQALERSVSVDPVEGVPHLSKDESQLLQEINKGLPAEMWAEYHALNVDRDDEALTPDQHKRLIEISNQIEVQNAHRIGALARLAEVRHTTLLDLMESLGIPQPENG